MLTIAYASPRNGRHRPQPQVEVKSMNHRPAANCALCRRRRRRRKGRLLVDLLHFVHLRQRVVWQKF